MRGLHFDGSRARLLPDIPEPVPPEGEALVRVRLAGVCNTDLEILKGYLPFRGVLGHEFVGTVESAPGCDDFVGERVVGEINASCGDCDACREGEGRHCASRTVLGIVGRGGCMAELCRLPVRNLHRVPPSVPDEAAVFTEPLAAAFRIPEQVAFAGGERVLVMGAGKLGLLIAMALRNVAGEVTVAGRHEAKLAVAAAAGARTVMADELDAAGPDGAGFDVVVEASGSSSGLASALARVRPLGTVVLKSTVAGDTTAPLSAAVVNEVTIVGSRCGPFAPALRALESGEVDPAPLITARYPLADAEAALARAAEPDALKVLVECGTSG
ncbi:MAG: alcohol dehydrogenase catalytic domain-containing protein [Planctomycetota bacterium]|jgi:threonine dehydrogenase-like Zn-dependent dehydrogenase